MKIPIVGLITAACAAVGGYGLYWYENLTKGEREEADQMACEYAKRIYDRELHQLTQSERSRIIDIVKSRF